MNEKQAKEIIKLLKEISGKLDKAVYPVAFPYPIPQTPPPSYPSYPSSPYFYTVSGGSQ